MGGCLSATTSFLYGDISQNSSAQAAYFAALLANIVGVYWAMRSLKDSVFATLVGLEQQPLAKMLSLLVVTALLFVYNKVVDLVPRHQLFAVLCGGYALLFGTIAALLASTTYGLYDESGAALPASPTRYLGWVHYFAIESYGSLAVSLFWQYVNSQLDLKQAKGMYGIITAGGQIGAIAGSTLVTGSKRFGVPQLYGVGAVFTAVPPLIMLSYLRRFPDAKAEGAALVAATAPSAAAKSVRPGLLEGLRLLIRHPYVLGIFGISALFEVIATILDYQMKVLGKARHASTADFAAFMGLFGQATNTVSLVFSVVGTSFVIRNLGLRPTLMLFPSMLAVAVSVVYVSPSLWVLFAVMVAIKGLAYALNNPSKEMLYMVTTDSIKFKAKSWIDAFGGRASKAVGSIVTNAFKHPMSKLMLYGSIISLSLAASLFCIASALGNAFNQLSASGEFVGLERLPHTSEESRGLKSVDEEEDEDDS